MTTNPTAASVALLIAQELRANHGSGLRLIDVVNHVITLEETVTGERITVTVHATNVNGATLAPLPELDD